MPVVQETGRGSHAVEPGTEMRFLVRRALKDELGPHEKLSVIPQQLVEKFDDNFVWRLWNCYQLTARQTDRPTREAVVCISGSLVSKHKSESLYGRGVRLAAGQNPDRVYGGCSCLWGYCMQRDLHTAESGRQRREFPFNLLHLFNAPCTSLFSTKNVFVNTLWHP